MKNDILILISLIFGIISCEKDENPNYSLLLTNGNTKVWKLDSITFDEFSIFMIAVDSCTADDKYIFKNNNLIIYDNNGTEYDKLRSPWGICSDSIILRENTWELEGKFLKIGEEPYEIYKISQNQMTLRNHVRNIPHTKLNSIPLYNYEVYSAIE